jgi:hypothetical protein
MSYRSKTYRPGDRVVAREETEISREVERIGQIRGSAGVLVRDGAIALDLPERIYIRLTSSANGDGGYAWKEVLPAALGTWIDSGRTGSASADPAYERGTKLTTLTAGDTVYEAMRAETTGEWLFA